MVKKVCRLRDGPRRRNVTYEAEPCSAGNIHECNYLRIRITRHGAMPTEHSWVRYRADNIPQWMREGFALLDFVEVGTEVPGVGKRFMHYGQLAYSLFNQYPTNMEGY